MSKTCLDYLIIGSGIAGLSAAKRLSQDAKVGVLTKSSLIESSTNYAQGGIAAALGSDDKTKFHYEDTLAAGCGLCNRRAVKVLVEEGLTRVRELIDLGANFDKTGTEFHFGVEGAHGKRRVLHAGDSTGKEIEKTLGANLIKEAKVKFYENVFVKELIVKNQECLGCLAIQKEQVRPFYAKAVILATGGGGQIYARNTNPPVCTGDGIALALHAGADIQDMEFIQFHPTTLYLGDKKPISIFLITEAVRGEGAVLRNIHGHRFLQNYHPDQELAPRDIVSQAIIQEMKKTKAQHVYLDLTKIPQAAHRFPTIYKRCLEAKIDIARDFVPVAPAAHYFMGGVKTDLKAQTSIKRLYAAGEVASLGLHGANRLASNSLLDGLVFGWRAAENALKLSDLNTKVVEQSLKELNLDFDNITTKQKARIMLLKQEIREIMWRYVGIKRHQKDLEKARQKLLKAKWMLALKPPLPSLIEAQNMLLVSLLTTHFALHRQESRGSHYRSDYPFTDNEHWQKHYVQNIKEIQKLL
jgi:L-aspartate oxidase